MSARLTITPPYSAGGHQPFALLNVWVGNEIHYQGALGIWRKHIEWLPVWLPFNSWLDESFAAQKKYVDWVEAQAKQLYGNVIREFSERPTGEPSNSTIKEKL